MNQISTNKIIYHTLNNRVIGLYVEGEPLPVGGAIGECKNFHRHYHLSVYNPETQMMELGEREAANYVAHEKQRYKREVKRLFDAKAKTPVRFNGAKWDADEAAVKNITKWLQHLQMIDILPAGFVWRDADNKQHPFATLNELTSFLSTLLKLILTREAYMLKAVWAEKDRIDAIETLEDAEAFGVELDFSTL